MSRGGPQVEEEPFPLAGIQNALDSDDYGLHALLGGLIIMPIIAAVFYRLFAAFFRRPKCTIPALYLAMLFAHIFSAGVYHTAVDPLLKWISPQLPELAQSIVDRLIPLLAVFAVYLLTLKHATKDTYAGTINTLLATILLPFFVIMLVGIVVTLVWTLMNGSPPPNPFAGTAP